MDQAAVAAAIQRLEAQGKALSLGNIRKQLGGGSWRDIVKWKRTLLGNGDTREEGEVSVDMQGTLALGAPVPPRAPTPSPPGAGELAARVAAAEAERNEALGKHLCNFPDTPSIALLYSQSLRKD